MHAYSLVLSWIKVYGHIYLHQSYRFCFKMHVCICNCVEYLPLVNCLHSYTCMRINLVNFNTAIIMLICMSYP